MWRGDLSPLGCEAAPKLTHRCIRLIELLLLGLLRSPAGINPLATEQYFYPTISLAHRHLLIQHTIGEQFTQFNQLLYAQGDLSS